MIKMMTGILVPSDGALSVLGRTPHLKRMDNAREIGVVFGQRSQLWWDLPLVHSYWARMALIFLRKQGQVKPEHQRD
jgi:ABC-2 type transport system ATP-binding protein